MKLFLTQVVILLLFRNVCSTLSEESTSSNQATQLVMFGNGQKGAEAYETYKNEKGDEPDINIIFFVNNSDLGIEYLDFSNNETFIQAFRNYGGVFTFPTADGPKFALPVGVPKTKMNEYLRDFSTAWIIIGVIVIVIVFGKICWFCCCVIRPVCKDNWRMRKRRKAEKKRDKLNVDEEVDRMPRNRTPTDTEV